MPIEFMDDGINIFFNDSHPLKALDPIEVTDEGIAKYVNDLHR